MDPRLPHLSIQPQEDGRDLLSGYPARTVGGEAAFSYLEEGFEESFPLNSVKTA